jgi:hypothetical protein
MFLGALPDPHEQERWRHAGPVRDRRYEVARTFAPAARLSAPRYPEIIVAIPASARRPAAAARLSTIAGGI